MADVLFPGYECQQDSWHESKKVSGQQTYLITFVRKFLVLENIRKTIIAGLVWFYSCQKVQRKTLLRKNKLYSSYQSYFDYHNFGYE